jgi:hydroxyacylglutathione hydrolase
MMYESLHDVLGNLEPSTKVYCGHEYTVSNLRFAQHVEPHHEAVAAALEDAKARRSARQPTVPSTIARELDTNPFLRCDQPAVCAFARSREGGRVDPASVFAAVREAKNQFKG